MLNQRGCISVRALASGLLKQMGSVTSFFALLSTTFNSLGILSGLEGLSRVKMIICPNGIASLYGGFSPFYISFVPFFSLCPFSLRCWVLGTSSLCHPSSGTFSRLRLWSIGSYLKMINPEQKTATA